MADRIAPLDASELREKAGFFAAAIFDKTGYQGDDGGLFWQVAGIFTLRSDSKLTEGDIMDAAHHAKHRAAQNKVGYFYTLLEKAAAKRKISLALLLQANRLPPGFDCSPPRQIYEPASEDLGHVADEFKLSSTGT